MRKLSTGNEGADQQQVHYISPQSKPVSKILQSQQIFIDQEYEEIVVNFKSLMSEKIIKIETHYFVIEVSSKKANRVWDIERRYSDFQWLYNALYFSYPGCILPYLPVKTIQNFMVTKLGIQYGEQSKQQHLSLRKDQLQLFLTKICKHDLLKQAQQTKIFLSQNKQQFAKNKKLIEGQINESQGEESLSNGIVSIFQRGMAWIAKGNSQEAWKIQNIEGWDQTQKQIRLWIYQYSALVQKVYKLIELKRSQAEWQGPQTQIDSVQQLKARIVSGQQYNRIFQQDLHENIIKNIAYQTKSLKQLQSQLARRDNIISIIQYIYKFANSSSGNNRSNKLLRKKQKFETNMSRQWPLMKEQLRYKIRSVQKKFNQIWLKYCRKVCKIWRQK